MSDIVESVGEVIGDIGSAIGLNEKKGKKKSKKGKKAKAGEGSSYSPWLLVGGAGLLLYFWSKSGGKGEPEAKGDEGSKRANVSRPPPMPQSSSSGVGWESDEATIYASNSNANDQASMNEDFAYLCRISKM